MPGMCSGSRLYDVQKRSAVTSPLPWKSPLILRSMGSTSAFAKTSAPPRLGSTYLSMCRGSRRRMRSLLSLFARSSRATNQPRNSFSAHRMAFPVRLWRPAAESTMRLLACGQRWNVSSNWKEVGVSVPLPESGQEQDWDLLCVSATAILSGVPVRLPGAGTGEVEWPRAFYNRLVQISGPCTLPLAQGVYPFAGIDALTEAVIGPIRLCLELKNCAAEVKAGVQELDANRALVKLEYESVLFLFDRYLKSA